MNQTILQANKLSIGYTSKKEVTTIATDINISLNKGKLITLIGGNGIGKSTLLRTITAIQKPISGEVFLNEKNIFTIENSDLAQQQSLVLTDKLPSSNLSVWELIALGRQPYTNWIGTLSEEDFNKITTAIKLTNIEHLIEKKHHEISDGQLQKVLIARALAQDTDLIILDEPTTHLDLFHKVSVFKLLQKLTHETGKCILFSTHDIDLAIQLSDEMIVMTDEFCIQDQPCNLIQKGKSITKAKTVKGEIPVIAGGQSAAYFHNVSNRAGNIITVSASGAYSGFVNYFSTPIFASDCNTIQSIHEDKLPNKLLFHLLKVMQSDIYKLQRGQAQPHVYKDDLEMIKIPILDKKNAEIILSEIENLEKKAKTVVIKDLDEQIKNIIKKHL